MSCRRHSSSVFWTFSAIALLSFLLQVTQPGAAAAQAGGDDPLLAPLSRCAGQEDASGSLRDQKRAMLCLTNYARRKSGRKPFAAPRKLQRSADRKAHDMLSCDEFSHEACGREFAYWIKRFGYAGKGCYRAGENIAIGTGELAAPRQIFAAWLDSPGHRRNILGPFEDIGVGLRIGSFEGKAGTHAWTQHFGSHC